MKYNSNGFGSRVCVCVWRGRGGVKMSGLEFDEKKNWITTVV
jgi:hypothetical protein